MKKTVCLALALLLMLAASAWARTFAIGEATFSYAVPEGYIECDKNGNETERAVLDFFAAADAQFGMPTLSVMLPEEMREPGMFEKGLDRHIVVQTVANLENLHLSKNGFALFKRLRLSDVDPSQQANDFADDYFGDHENRRTVTLLNRPVVLKNSDDLLVYWTVVLIGEEAGRHMFGLTNHSLINNKVVSLLYLQAIRDEADIPGAVEQGLALFQTVNVRPQEPEKPQAPARDARDALDARELTRKPPERLLWFSAAAAAAGAIITLALVLSRKKDKK